MTLAMACQRLEGLPARPQSLCILVTDDTGYGLPTPRGPACILVADDSGYGLPTPQSSCTSYAGRRLPIAASRPVHLLPPTAMSANLRSTTTSACLRSAATLMSALCRHVHLSALNYLVRLPVLESLVGLPFALGNPRLSLLTVCALCPTAVCCPA